MIPEFTKIKSVGIFLFLICALCFSSCSNSPKNVTAIPKETDIVSVIDVYSIIKKGRLDEVSDMSFFKTFKKEIRSENRKLSRIIDNIIEDPSITGINFRKDLFVFYVDEASDEQFFSFSVAINNKNKFAGFIEDMMTNIDVEFDIEEMKNYSYLLIENSAAIGWDSEKAVLLIPMDYRSNGNLDFTIGMLMGLEDNEQITENEEFNRFYKDKKDISVWLSTNFFEDDEDFKQASSKSRIDLTDSYISSYLDFKDNKASLLSRFTPNKEIQLAMEEHDLWGDTFSNEVFKYFPENNYATASISVDPVAYYEMLQDVEEFDDLDLQLEEEMKLSFKDIFQTLNGNFIFSVTGFENMELPYLDWGYGFNEELAELLEEKHPIYLAGYLSSEDRELLNQGKTIQASTYGGRYCINIKNILDQGGTVETALDNDSNINWYEGGWDYGQYIEVVKQEYVPLMGFAFDINDDKVIKDILDELQNNEGLIKKKDHYYEFKAQDMYPAYFAFNDEVCLITNDIKSIKAFKNRGYSSGSLSNSKISSEISNSKFYTFLNLNYDEYERDVKKEVRDNLDKDLLRIWNNFAKSAELKLIDKNTIEIVFNTKDHKSNSLNTILKTLDKNYKTLISL